MEKWKICLPEVKRLFQRKFDPLRSSSAIYRNVYVSLRLSVENFPAGKSEPNPTPTSKSKSKTNWGDSFSIKRRTAINTFMEGKIYWKFPFHFNVLNYSLNVEFSYFLFPFPFFHFQFFIFLFFPFAGFYISIFLFAIFCFLFFIFQFQYFPHSAVFTFLAFFS